MSDISRLQTEIVHMAGRSMDHGCRYAVMESVPRARSDQILIQSISRIHEKLSANSVEHDDYAKIESRFSQTISRIYGRWNDTYQSAEPEKYAP